jgi:predicted nucleotidyltransferase
LRGCLPEAARRLRALGAKRVVLFGSLAYGGEPHPTTDVDLAVEGLDEGTLAHAMFDLEALFQAGVDLVAIERASHGLAASIAADGRELRED